MYATNAVLPTISLAMFVENLIILTSCWRMTSLQLQERLELDQTLHLRLIPEISSDSASSTDAKLDLYLVQQILGQLLEFQLVLNVE
jgi:hypothetical protein